ncbi:MAG: Maf family protein [Oscillospiraceae bacterium]
MSLKIRRLLKDKKVVLASQSPRRKELLKIICDDFEICPAQGEEILPENTPAVEAAELLARNKCGEVAQKYGEDAIVIACDTIVAVDGEIMGKPQSHRQAADMLGSLSGKTHSVISGGAFCINGKISSFSEITKVTFRQLSDEDIADYIATGEPFDKAGAYGIQGFGSLLVSGIEGDYFNVVGLPLSSLAENLERFL